MKLKKIGYLIMICVLSVLSYIIPKKKNRLLFADSYGFIGNSKYLFLEASEYNHLNCFFITTNIHNIDKIYKNNFILKSSIKSLFYLLTSKYIFVNSGCKDIFNGEFFGNFNIVNLWHGIPIKKIGIDNAKNVDNHFFLKIKKILNKKLIHSMFIMFSSTNRISSVHIKKAFSNIVNVRVLGYPRNDVFFKKTNYSNSVKKLIRKEKGKQIFLYAPTFRDNNSILIPFSSSFLLELNEYLKKNNQLLFIKLHPNTENIKLYQKYSNIKDISSNSLDFQELLKISDVLVTDYSSSYFDFSLQRKPMISYIYDYDDYVSKNRELYFDFKKDIPSFIASNENELLTIIKKIDTLFKSKIHKEKYEKFLNKFNKYIDGNSSDRILKFLKLI